MEAPGNGLLFDTDYFLMFRSVSNHYLTKPSLITIKFCKWTDSLEKKRGAFSRGLPVAIMSDSCNLILGELAIRRKKTCPSRYSREERTSLTFP